jgi:hypothetical protein
MRPLTALILALLLLPGAARAHPVPKDNHDRTLVVRLTPEAVLVDYRLEVDELRAALDLRALEKDLPTSRQAIPAALADAVAAALADTLDDLPLHREVIGPARPRPLRLPLPRRLVADAWQGACLHPPRGQLRHGRREPAARQPRRQPVPDPARRDRS